ncbi:MAG: hypothetical protein OEZ41_04105 [Nitrospirota bacterium]|nr:hypothetical protein [Nitrospirota bacterium]MDH5699126.1 hypothetical protein [Nitrospirota bacterium]
MTRCQANLRYVSTALLLAVIIGGLGMARCSWDEVKETGYGTMREYQTQRCMDDPSRQTSECVDQQPYDSYQRERSVPPGSPSRVQ